MSGPNVNYAYQIKNQHLRFRLRGKIVTCNKLAQHMRGQRLGLSLFGLTLAGQIRFVTSSFGPWIQSNKTFHF